MTLTDLERVRILEQKYNTYIHKDNIKETKVNIISLIQKYKENYKTEPFKLLYHDVKDLITNLVLNKKISNMEYLKYFEEVFYNNNYEYRNYIIEQELYNYLKDKYG